MPSNPTRKVAGYLSYSENRIELDLVGCFDDITGSDDEFSYLIINGTLGLKPVLLYDCYENKRSVHFSAMDYTTLIVNMIFFGINATKTSSLRFHRCSFEPTYFNQWVNKKDSLDVKMDRLKFKVAIEYELPDPITTILSTGQECKIAFRASGPGFGFHRRDPSIVQKTYFSYESRKKQELRILLSAISHYSKLIMLFTHKPTYMDNIRIFYRKPRSTEYLEADLYRTSRARGETKDPNPYEFILYYSDISSDYDSILDKWFSHISVVNTSLNSYFDTFFTSSNVDDFALNILKSMESYHREMISSRRINIKDRYMELFERVRRTFNPYLKIRSKSKYCDKLKNLRNDLAHNNPLTISHVGVYKSRYHLVMEARLILTCNILFDLGLSLTQIRHLIGRSYAYSGIKKV